MTVKPDSLMRYSLQPLALFLVRSSIFFAILTFPKTHPYGFNLSDSMFFGLCRVSLMYKSAAEKTWSLAPSLHLKADISNPQTLIVCYTSLQLREIVLEGLIVDVDVYDHLRDHCPNLRRLSIAYDNIMHHYLSENTLGRILERLEEFKIHKGENFLKGDPTNRLLSAVSQCQRSPSITCLDLAWETQNLTFLKLILEKLPALKTFRMPLKRNCINLIDLFPVVSRWNV
jgi:hypothetical protein